MPRSEIIDDMIEFFEKIKDFPTSTENPLSNAEIA